MRRSHQSDRYLPCKHRLHRSTRNDEDKLSVNAVFTKNALLFGDPERFDVVADGAVRQQDFRRLSRERRHAK